MVEKLLKFNVPELCWVEFFSNINPIVREEVEWELGYPEDFEHSEAFESLMAGYNEYRRRVESFGSEGYKSMLSICQRLDESDIKYEPGREFYWREVYSFLNKLFEDVPALNSDRLALIKKSEMDQIRKEKRTEGDLFALANRISDACAGKADSDEDIYMDDSIKAFCTFIKDNPKLFQVGQDVGDGRTMYTVVFKRRAILRNCLYSIKFLLDRYESGEDPSAWRHV